MEIVSCYEAGYDGYVALIIMLRTDHRRQRTPYFANALPHIIIGFEDGYSAFKKLIKEGVTFPRRAAPGTAEMSTLARALAFISMSTSA